MPARADEVADFYKGKTVQLVVGYGPGGGYDVYARVLARHMANDAYHGRRVRDERGVVR